MDSTARSKVPVLAEARQPLYDSLAARYGTPLLVIDTGVLDGNLARFGAAASAAGISVCYAAKALFFVALARRFASSGLLVDVCSLGELVTAERGGFDPGRIVFHGCGKSHEELAAIASGRVARSVVDHHEELLHLAAAASAEHPVEVLFRVNTGIEAHTHDFIRTTGAHTKFGFLPDELDAALAIVRQTPGLRLGGLHAHIGSQIVDAAAFDANVIALLESYERLRAQGEALGELTAGGGFGVDAGGTPVDIEATLLTLGATLRRECARRGIPLPRLSIEPGRAIVAGAGTSVYRVVALKRRGARRFAIVDGSLADNPRHLLYGADHPARLVARGTSAALEATTICGRSCESDELGDALLPADLRAGDLLAFAATGAYTFSMASNYNRFARPAVVFDGPEGTRLAVRRETIDDVLANDLDDA